MKVEVINTQDGSHSLQIMDSNVTYHSIFGAIEESNHVFIRAGLLPLSSGKEQINILEVGLGTGLNALLTAINTNNIKIYYEAIEPNPLSTENIVLLNYGKLVEQENLFKQIHKCESEQANSLTDYFTLNKRNCTLESFETNKKFDLVYYDAFAPNHQPELWTEEVFRKVLAMMNTNGVLVTYCCKGSVVRAMKAVGFTIEKLKGPPRKREMIRARKP